MLLLCIFKLSSKGQIGKLQGAYFAGYTGSMIVGVTFLLKHCGAFTGVLLLTFLSGALNFVFPVATLSIGFNGALLCRFLLGILQGK